MAKKVIKFLFEENCTFNLLCCILWGFTLFNYMVAAIRHFFTFIPCNQYITIPIILIIIFYALPQILKRLQLSDILFYIIFIITYLLQYILFPNNIAPLNEFALKCCFWVFPFYFFGKIVDMPKMFNAFYYISAATVGLFVFYFIIYGKGSSQVSTDDYNMGAAYNLLPHVLMVVWKTIRDFSPLRIIIALTSIVLLLMFGTRGPILSLILPITIYVLFAYHGKHARVLKFFLIIIAIALFLLIIPVAMYLNDIFDSLNVNSRIFEKILNDDIENDSGRGALIVELNRHLFTENRDWGYGLFGSYQFIGGYPHNIFYELIFSFGFFIGSILIVLMLWHFVKGYRYAGDSISREFILLFTIMELTHLCFSNTFLMEPMFFLICGLCTRRCVPYTIENKKI